MELCVQIEFVLHERSEMGAQDTRLVSGSARPIIPDCRILSQSYADADSLKEASAVGQRLGGSWTNLLREVLHVLDYERAAGGVEEDGEAPGVAKGDEVGLAREEVDVEDAKE